MAETTYTGVNQNRQFGTELEITIQSNAVSSRAAGYPRSKSGLYRWLKDNGVAVAGNGPLEYHGGRYVDPAYTMWRVERDGSLFAGRDAEDTAEVISPILKGSEGIAEVKRVMNLLDAFGCSANRSCGNHIHHWIGDYDDRALRNLYKLYRAGQSAINSVLPRSRRDNPYCSQIRLDWEAIISQSQRRYSTLVDELRMSAGQILSTRLAGHGPAINFARYLTTGTVEFRQNAGTVNFEKWYGWFCLTHAIVETASKWAFVRADRQYTLKQLMTTVGFYSKRIGCWAYKPTEEFKQARAILVKREAHFAAA